MEKLEKLFLDGQYTPLGPPTNEASNSSSPLLPMEVHGATHVAKQKEGREVCGGIVNYAYSFLGVFLHKAALLATSNDWHHRSDEQ